MEFRLPALPPQLRSLHRTAWVALVAVALVLVRYRVGDAHTTLLSSEPAAGIRLSAFPPRIRLVFSEPIEAGMATLSIAGSAGQRVTLAPSGDPHDVHAIVAPVDSLGVGAYRVTWHVVSADGHPVGGSYTFSVGAATGGVPPVAAPSADTSDTTGAAWGPSIAGAPVVAALLRGAAVGCVMALGGVLLFIVWLRAPLNTRPARVARGLAIAAPCLFAAHFLVWLMNASPTQGLSAEWFSTAIASTAGRAELWRTLLALPPIWALALTRRPGVALALTVVALVMSAAVGHSAAVHPLLAIPFKAVHLLGAAAWMGGLLWLVTREPHRAANVSAEAFQVSSVSLIAVAAVVVSGVVQTAILLPSLHDLLSSYGAIAGAKVAGLLVLIAFGAHHRYRVLPRIAEHTDSLHPSAKFRTSLSRELAVFSIVVLLGGLLAYVSPPHPLGDAHQQSHPETSP